jgi:hypothetical protein
MGRIIEVRLDRTFNMGNYESAKIGLTASVSEKEDPQDILEKLNNEAEDFYRFLRS